MNVNKPLIIVFIGLVFIITILVKVTGYDFLAASEVANTHTKGLKNLVAKKDSLAKRGFNFYNKKRTPLLLLLSRYDNDSKKNIVELIDLVDGKKLHSWIFPDLSIFSFDKQNQHQTRPSQINLESSKVIHPLLNKDGSLVFHFYERSPLFSVNACGELTWKNLSAAFHHSLEKDSQGNYWSAGNRDSIHSIYGKGFLDDMIVKVSPNGRTLFTKSVLEILIENNLHNKVYTYDRFVKDPIHLNDIQPALEDGKYWKQGDLFLSLSHLNLILLYRPNTNRLIWWKQEYMMHQHDIDIIGSDKISIFNNNRITTQTGDSIVGTNEILVFDFTKNSFSSPFKELFLKEQIRTVNQGLSHIGESGQLFVEETRSGRLLFFGPKGKKEWEFINKDSKGNTFVLNWSRIIPYSMKASLLNSFSKCL
jgi:hypothetical protein